ncbi:MAG: Mov34/MPN/PAD-1 family protein [Syntrophothermus sp.]|uniref:Mov34/MPN/PAD-1 family protein n=1 Tax=Syntrophothermus sp. TaxID=2736299 RepID=UPI00257C8850|nr:Mov34/MPN/PAD-1 family protein [Syntrophothermus sp.]NSW84464.1 Mov34/MPN/PAD-1 family protein [Syntrophothermus sp.]
MNELRGHFKSIKELVENIRPINILMGRDGLYEVRKTELGTFSVKTDHVYDLDEVDEGFCPSLPRIPFAVLSEVLAFFRAYAETEEPSEVLAEIYWDRENLKYFAWVPEQVVTSTEINARIDREMSERHLLVVECHSHNNMPAKFSQTDDENQQATGLYLVVGKLNKYFPELKLRMSCGGKYKEIPLETMFEYPFSGYPQDWDKKVQKSRIILPNEEELLYGI